MLTLFGSWLIKSAWLAILLSVTDAWAQRGLRGEYYQGTNFGQKVYTRIDPTVDFNWSTRAPLPVLDWSYYSIRWTGQLRAPASGRYTFYCEVDDGIRVWVGKQLVIDEWHLTPYRHFEGQIDLVAGQTYPIRIDYFNDIQGGKINVRWERPDQPKRWLAWLSEPGETIPATYFLPPSRPDPLPGEPAVPRLKKDVPLAANPVLTKPKQMLTTQRWAAHTRLKSVNGTPPVLPPTGLSPPPLVTPLTLLFDQSSYILTRSSLRQLDSVRIYWQMNPPVQIEVVGHADRIGDRALNRTLSEYRTRVVVAYLTRHGIAPTQLRGLWHGDAQLLISDPISALRFQNRRVLILSHYN